MFRSAPPPGDNKGTWENKVLRPAWKHMDRFGGKIGEPQKGKETESIFFMMWHSRLLRRHEDPRHRRDLHYFSPIIEEKPR